jgi:hypothetical protein
MTGSSSTSRTAAVPIGSATAELEVPKSMATKPCRAAADGALWMGGMREGETKIEGARL